MFEKVKVQCSQRQEQNKECDLHNERERLKQELAEEKRAHAEIENYLKKHIEVKILIIIIITIIINKYMYMYMYIHIQCVSELKIDR